MRLCKHGVPMNVRHDCTYVDKRDALIPQAEEHANKLAGPRPNGTREDSPEYEAWVNRWNWLFHDRMDRLWKELKERAA